MLCFFQPFVAAQESRAHVYSVKMDLGRLVLFTMKDPACQCGDVQVRGESASLAVCLMKVSKDKPSLLELDYLLYNEKLDNFPFYVLSRLESSERASVC